MPKESMMNPSSTEQASSPTNTDVTKAKDALVETASHLKDDVKHAAGAAATQAKQIAESKFDTGRDLAAEHLDSVASALRKAGDELRSNDSPVTDYVHKAASGVDRLSYYLQTRTLSHMIGDLERFSRREPAMFLGGAFVAGLLGGRLLKSATPMREPGDRLEGERPVAALPAYGSPEKDRTAGPREAYPWVKRQEGSTQASTGTGTQGSEQGSATSSGASTSGQPTNSGMRNGNGTQPGVGG